MWRYEYQDIPGRPEHTFLQMSDTSELANTLRSEWIPLAGITQFRLTL